MKRKFDEVDNNRQTSLEPNPSIQCTRGPFPSTTSIALIGLRGVGKSTIGVLISTALRRRLIDQNLYFSSKTGITIEQYISTHDWSKYCDKQSEILSELLLANPHDAVIVCSSDCVERKAAREALREWCTTHPVIHVVRPAEEVALHLGKKSASHKTAQYLRLAAKREPIYSTCSNYEFYNWKDKRSPLLPLKKVEQHILRLVNSIFQTDISSLVVRSRNRIVGDNITAGVESKAYSYSLALPNAKGVMLEDLDIEEMETVVEAFELRVDNLVTADNIDYRRVSQQFSYLRRYSALPIIYHVSARTEFDEEDYIQLLFHGFRLGADYVVVDLELEESQLRTLIDSKGSTKVIGQYHDTTGSWDDPTRLEKYTNASRLSFDFIKLTQPATSTDDNLACISFSRSIRRSSSIPLIAYNTGPLGKLSRIFNPILSPVTHPSLTPADTSADELTPKEALRALHACSVFPKLHFYIFGSAVSHSLSPSLHNAAFEAYGLPHKYHIFESSTINGLQHLLHDTNFGGVSITLPYKQEVIALLQTISDDAKIIGAVNTIVPIRQEGKILALHGENTDWIGIRSCILKNLTPVNAITARSTALVCGAGGMARAAIYALQKLGFENVFIVNRTESRAFELARQFNEMGLDGRGKVHVIPSLRGGWPEGFGLPCVVVSCIPTYAVQSGEVPNFVIPEEWLRSRTGGVCVEVTCALGGMLIVVGV
jgi:3-dehydroquinate dehydratase type I